MGKGDKRSKKGKIITGTYGVTRPKADNKKSAKKTEAAKK